jgi:putative PIN family toxin of toxin-antitoxin system
MKKVNNAYKVIIDTNVWISFLIGKSLAGLHKFIYHEKIAVITCKEQLLELSEVLHRPKIKKRFSQKHINEFFSLLDEVALLVEISTISSICRDPKDDYLLSLSIESDANYLVTGDLDLLIIKKINNTEIINYSDFEKKMKFL